MFRSKGEIDVVYNLSDWVVVRGWMGVFDA